MLHYKEISYQENINDLKNLRELISVNFRIKDNKVRFSKRLLDKDPMDWFKDMGKKLEIL